MPIEVFIAPGTNCRGYRNDFVNTVRSAFADWSSASNGVVTFRFVDSPAKARIKVLFTDTTSAFSEAGLSSECVPYEKNGVLTAADVKLLTIDTVQPLQVLSDPRFRVRALQTIGKSIGIFGGSQSPSDVMYLSETVDPQNTAISSRDAKDDSTAVRSLIRTMS